KVVLGGARLEKGEFHKPPKRKQHRMGGDPPPQQTRKIARIPRPQSAPRPRSPPPRHSRVRACNGGVPAVTRKPLPVTSRRSSRCAKPFHLVAPARRAATPPSRRRAG